MNKISRAKFFITLIISLLGVCGLLFTNMTPFSKPDLNSPQMTDPDNKKQMFLKTSARLNSQITNSKTSDMIKIMYKNQKRLVDDIISGQILAKNCQELSKTVPGLVSGIYKVFPKKTSQSEIRVKCIADSKGQIQQDSITIADLQEKVRTVTGVAKKAYVALNSSPNPTSSKNSGGYSISSSSSSSSASSSSFGGTNPLAMPVSHSTNGGSSQVNKPAATSSSNPSSTKVPASLPVTTTSNGSNKAPPSAPTSSKK